jgi:peptidoglycan/LPS O-acetylase OafA/YrhL
MNSTLLKFSGVALSGSRLAEMDVLRGLAALAVVIFHYSGHCQRYFSNFPFPFEYGKYGVHFFFVISGFFIYLTAEKCGNAQEFLLLRFSRLYPAYWATLIALLSFDLAQPGSKVWLNGYLVNATMLQSFVGFPDIDIVFWSLAVEMTFYILMTTLFATGAIRHPLLVTLVWLGLGLLWPSVQDSPVGQIKLIQSLAGVLTYGPFFIGGMMYYRLHQCNFQHPGRYLGMIFLCAVTAWVTGGTTVGMVSVLAFSLVGLALRGYLRCLISPVTLWLGAISYSLYLVHRNLGYTALFKLDAMGMDSRVAFVVVICGALALASVLTYWIEQPSLRWLRGRVRSLYPK